MNFLPIFEPARWAPKANESVIEYWASLSPVAPLFGVAWRFGEMAVPKARVTAAAAKPANPILARAPAAPVPAPVPVMDAEVVAEAKPASAPASAAPAAAKPVATPSAAMLPVAANGGPVQVEVSRKPGLTPRAAEPEALETEEAPDAPLQVSVPLETAAVPAKPAEPVQSGDTAVLSRPASLLAAPPARIDDLKMIKGVGPKLERELNSLGIYTFAQVAGFSLEDLAWVDSQLSIFKGRPFRDNWIDQARLMLKS